MIKYKQVYKCQLCGELYFGRDVQFETKEDAFDRENKNIRNTFFATFHACRNGDVGNGYFVGLKFDGD